MYTHDLPASTAHTATCGGFSSTYQAFNNVHTLSRPIAQDCPADLLNVDLKIWLIQVAIDCICGLFLWTISMVLMCIFVTVSHWVDTLGCFCMCAL